MVFNVDWSTRLGLTSVSCNDACNPTAQKLEENVSCAETKIQDEGPRPENDGGNANTSQGHNNELLVSSGGAIDLIGSFDNGAEHLYGDRSINNDKNKFESSPQLELSLRRSFPNNPEHDGVEEKHLLNHSNASAFSW